MYLYTVKCLLYILFKDKSKISDYEYRSTRCLMHIRKKYVISEM